MGYRFDFSRGPHLATGLGVLGGVAFLPEALQVEYGERPLSTMVFAHVDLR